MSGMQKYEKNISEIAEKSVRGVYWLKSLTSNATPPPRLLEQDLSSVLQPLDVYILIGESLPYVSLRSIIIENCTFGYSRYMLKLSIFLEITFEFLTSRLVIHIS